MKLPTSALLAAALAVGSVGSARAAYVTFFGQDLNNSESIPLASTPNSAAAEKAFLKDMTGVGTATFEASTTGTKAPLTLSFPGFSEKLSATLNGNGQVASVPIKTAVAGRYSIPSANTTQFWAATALSGNVNSSSFSLAFGQAIAAFGFYGVDVGDFGGQLQLQLMNGSTLIETVEVPNTSGTNGSTGGSVLYFGLIAEEPIELFDRIDFLMTTGFLDDVFAFDNFSIAEQRQVAPPTVPEPTTLALLAGGLLALGLTRRRRG